MTVRTSQNGYPCLTRDQLAPYLIGSRVSVWLRPGPAGWLLAHFGSWFDSNIRDIDAGALDDWGWAARPVRGTEASAGEVPSNHESGTALDLDATKWPLGSEPTKYLTLPEIARLHAQLTVYEGAIRWGGDYTGRKDPMHVEINKDEAFCARIVAKLQHLPLTPEEEDDMALLVQVAGDANGAGGGYWIRDGAGYDWISEIATVGELQRAGVKTIKISQAEHVRWSQAQAARRG